MTADQAPVRTGGAITLRRIVMALLAVVAFACIVLAVRHTKTDGGADDVTISGGDNAVETLIPGRNAQALSQSEIGIDLAPGWTGVLQLNGQELSGHDVQEIPALNQILYRAPDGLESGRNCVTAVIWRSSESRGDGRNVSWCFDVT